jgi:hypothetical protein
MAIATGTALLIGAGVSAAGSAVKYAGARKNELKANKASRDANKVAAQATAALARAEAQSFVPGFSTASDRIPGYHTPIGATRVLPTLNDRTAKQQMLDNRDRSLGRPIPQQMPSVQNKPVFEPFGGDDVGDRASRTIIQPNGDPMNRGYQEAVRAGYDPTTGVSMRNNRGQNVVNELLKKRFEEVTRTLPKNTAGLPIFS